MSAKKSRAGRIAFIGLNLSPVLALKAAGQREPETFFVGRDCSSPARAVIGVTLPLVVSQTDGAPPYNRACLFECPPEVGCTLVSLKWVDMHRLQYGVSQLRVQMWKPRLPVLVLACKDCLHEIWGSRGKQQIVAIQEAVGGHPGGVYIANFTGDPLSCGYGFRRVV